MEILSGLEEGDGGCQPTLPDIDIDLLVSPGFNNPPPRNERAAAEAGPLDDGILCGNGNVAEENSFLDFDSIIDFSSQHVGDVTSEMQLDKSGVLSFLADPRTEDICYPTSEKHHTSQVSPSSATGPADEKALSRDANATPMTSSMQNIYAPTSLVMQNEWQDLAALLPCQPQNLIPSSVVNDVKMLPLDGPGMTTDQTAALQTNPSSGDAKFAPEIYQQPMQHSNSPKSLHLNATCPSQAFQQSLASSFQQSMTEGSHFRTLQTAPKQFKRKNDKMKPESLQESLTLPSLATAGASSTTTKKKSSGRRKVSDMSELLCGTRFPSK